MIATRLMAVFGATPPALKRWKAVRNPSQGGAFLAETGMTLASPRGGKLPFVWSESDTLVGALSGFWHDSGLAGQLTARAEKPGTYYMLRFGRGLDEATPDSLLLVDDDLTVLDGEGMPNPSNRFHLWIYRAKPRVHSIMHTIRRMYRRCP